MSAVGICVNPMSGRDVRRLAARATNMTFEAKRDIVACLAEGLDAAGVDDIFIAREPFRISTLAVEHLGLDARVHVLEHRIEGDAGDTERAVQAFVGAGCDVIVSLGGDGTQRAIARACPDVTLVPLSMGTNNVFPQLVEPSVAGLVAGHAAAGRLEMEPMRAKRLHVSAADGRQDIALIDAVLLRNDHVGNLLPFDPARLDRLLLTQAQPGAVGMSPVGGYLEIVGARDDAALLVQMGDGTSEGERRFAAPLSPGLFHTVSVREVTRLPFATPVLFPGPGVLALDGDRDHKIRPGETMRVEVHRDGPFVIDVREAISLLARTGALTGLRSR